MTDAPDGQSRAAIAAALAVASAQGLTVTDPRVVGRGSNRIVWLRPAPIVARVMTGTVVLHDEPRARLERARRRRLPGRRRGAGRGAGGGCGPLAARQRG